MFYGLNAPNFPLAGELNNILMNIITCSISFKVKESLWLTKKYSAAPGVCFIIPIGVSHGLEKIKQGTLVAYEVKFLINDKDLTQALSFRDPIFAGDSFFDTSIAYIVQNGRSRQPYLIKNTDAFLCALLSHISSKETISKLPESVLVDTAQYHEATTEVICLLESQYMNHLYLHDIAEQIGYNRNYLCSLFKKDTNITIIDYLNFVWIKKACEFIRYSNIDIKQIGSRVGFTNISHFNRTFKKLVGVSPSQFGKIQPVSIPEDTRFIDSFSQKKPSLANAIQKLWQKKVPPIIES